MSTIEAESTTAGKHTPAAKQVPPQPSLSDEQHKAVRAIHEWRRESHRKQVFRLFGAAGTGKSTIINHLCRELHGGVCIATYTGKAAHVLRQKGVADATTIHSVMYVPLDLDEDRLDAIDEEIAELERRLTKVGDGERKLLQRQLRSLKEQRTQLAQPRFGLNEDAPVANANLVILDEVSMVGEEIGRDLLSFGKPILVVGDPHQLPPIDGGAGFFTSGAADFELSQVHRQALESPIIRIATDIRNGDPYDRDYGPDVRFHTRAALDRHRNLHRALKWPDQLICGFNQTRAALNRRMLEYHGYGEVPYPTGCGEKLICLTNNHAHKLFNGMFVAFESSSGMPLECIDEHRLVAFVRPEDEPNRQPVQLEIYRGHFDNTFLYMKDRLDRDIRVRKQLTEIDFGYAVTCHKAQGSEWPKVMVIDDGYALRSHRDEEMRRRWLYTAVTRASDKLTIVTWP
jgi:exodeoxyribonuclease V